MKNQRKPFGLLFLSLAALAFTFVSCDKDDKVDVLNFSADKVVVEVGKSATVTVSGGTTPYAVTSSDPKIATAAVDNSTITITGVAKGAVSVTVKDKNNNSKALSVTVRDAVGIDFDKTSTTVAVGKEDIITIKGGVAPYTAEVKDASIATATIKDDKVTVKGVKAGTTTITVTGKDKKNSGTITVTVQ